MNSIRGAGGKEKGGWTNTIASSVEMRGLVLTEMNVLEVRML